MDTKLIKLQNQIAEFNSLYKEGDKVKVRLSDESLKECTVSAPAMVLEGHTAVGWFNEIRGCYSLNNVVK